MDEFQYGFCGKQYGAAYKYLSGEKLKVSKVREDILSSLQKADSLIKAKL